MTGRAAELADASTVGIQEAQFSLLVCGTDEKRWIAYSFADVVDEDHERGEEQYRGEDMEADPIADLEHDASFPIWNPREYFLMIVRIRISQVLREWRNLVRKVEMGIDQYEEDHSSLSGSTKTRRNPDDDFMNDFQWTQHMLGVLSELLERLSFTIDAWSGFTDVDGDWNYFKDLNPATSQGEQHLQGSLHEIRERFEDFAVIKQKLQSLVKRCTSFKGSAKFLQLRLTYQSNQAAQRNGSAAELAILAVSPVAAVSAFFATPSNILSLPRNSASFIISIIVMTLALRLLLMIARSHFHRDHLWKALKEHLRDTHIHTSEIGEVVTGYCSTDLFKRRRIRTDTMDTSVEDIPLDDFV